MAAVDTEQLLHDKLFHHSSALATERGLSAQSPMLRSFREQHLPLIRNSISQWLESFPKHLLHFVLLTAIAALIHPWLTLSAILASLIVRTLYMLQSHKFNSSRWLYKQRWTQSAEQMASLAQDAPLLATIHNSAETLDTFRSTLLTYRNSGQTLLGGERAKFPLVPIASVILGTLLLILLALGMLDPRKHLSLGLAVLWGSSMACAILSAYKLRLAWHALRKSLPMLHEVHEYLAIRPAPLLGSTKQLGNALAQGISAEHVTLQASDQQKLLDDITVHFKPGQLTVVISPDPCLAKALVEMILGFGQPSSGRLLFDTTRDATVDLRDVTDKARMSQAIFNLPDGLQTLVSAKEERLSADLLFRLGIARGFLKKPSLVVAEEPKASQPAAEVETTRALLELRNQKRIVVVLPNRISTLRAADQVVVMSHRKILDVGTHSELLERSELYRHWNYMHFAPRPE